MTKRSDPPAGHERFQPPHQDQESRRTESCYMCPIPGCERPLTRSHALELHLPEVFDDRLEVTDDLTRQRVAVLRACASLVCGSLSLDTLVSYINLLNQIKPGEIDVSKVMVSNMKAICHHLDIGEPEFFSLSPVNSPAALFHWRVMVVVFGCMAEGARNHLVKAFSPTRSNLPLGLPQAFDSHFHLDRSKKKLKKTSFHQVCEAVRPDEGFEVQVMGGVTVFCDPDTYPSQEEVNELRGQGLTIAIGLHPKYVEKYTEDSLLAFERCLTFSGVSALGEVGLDYSTSDKLWGQQHVLLDRALKQLRPEHVLVLHSRGPFQADTNFEMFQLLYQLKGVVPTEQRIHLHCFCGSLTTMEQWIAEFPNVHFGFTGMVGSFDEESRKALRQLDERRLLLETDAPYFRMGHREASAPSLLGMVANLVAKVRGQPWREVLEVAVANARRLYGF